MAKVGMDGEQPFGGTSLNGIAKATTNAFFENKAHQEAEQKKILDREKCNKWVKGFEESLTEQLLNTFEPKIFIVGDRTEIEPIQRKLSNIPSGALETTVVSTLVDLKQISSKSELVELALQDYHAEAQELKKRHDIELRPAAESAYEQYFMAGIAQKCAGISKSSTSAVSLSPDDVSKIIEFIEVPWDEKSKKDGTYSIVTTDINKNLDDNEKAEASKRIKEGIRTQLWASPPTE